MLSGQVCNIAAATRKLCAANTLLAAGKPEVGEATGMITVSDVNSAFEISERSRQLLLKYR